MSMIERIDRKLYPGFDRNWDDKLFRDTIMRRLTPHAVILDLGAGAGIVRDMNFRGVVQRVCGVDLDDRVLENPMLDEGRVGNAGSIPYPDGEFDIVFADNVVEHLEDPIAVFSEVARVLKPGGVFMFKTPNRSHYMPLVSQLTPHRFHRYFNRRRGRQEEDTFPTRYRANSKRAATRVAAASGFLVESIERIEGRPEYLRFSAPTYLLGAAYERIVNAIDLLACFRVLLIVQLRKPAK